MSTEEMTTERLHSVLLNAQWEKAKGELRATVALLEWDEERYDKFNRVAENFIKKIYSEHLG